MSPLERFSTSKRDSLKRFKQEMTLQQQEKDEIEEERLPSHAKIIMQDLGISIEDLKNKKVLDIGAGIAELAQYAKNFGYNIISLDNGSADFPGRIPEDLNYVKGEADKLPFQNESFDLILAHAAPPAITLDREEFSRIFSEVERVLKPGGEFRFGPGIEILSQEELFLEEENDQFSLKGRIQRKREKSLEFLKGINPDITEEKAMPGRKGGINIFYKLRKT